MRCTERLVVRHGGAEALDRLGVATAPLEKSAEQVVRRRQPGIDLQGRFERGQGGARRAGADQGRAEIQPHHRVARRHSDRGPELAHGLGPVLPGGRLQPQIAVGLGASQRRRQRGHQRVGHRHGGPGRVAGADAASTAAQVVARPLEIAEAPVGHRQRVVDHRSRRVPSQGRLEALYRARVVPRGKRRPAALVQQRLGVRIQGQAPGEERLRRLGPVEVDVGVKQPDDRRKIREVEPQDLLEPGGRPLEVPVAHGDVGQVVGPAEVSRRQFLRMSKADVRRVRVVPGEQERPQCAVRIGALPPARVRRRIGPAPPGRSQRDQGTVRGAELLLHRRMHAAESRQLARCDNRLGEHDRRGHGLRRDHAPCRELCDHGQTACERGSHRGLRPVPSISVVQRFMPTSAHSSTLPSGQTTRTRSMVAARPRPTRTRGSFADT